MVLLTVLCCLLSVHLSFSVTPNPEYLVTLINNYRESLNLPKVPISYTLSKLAQAHADSMVAAGPSVACSYQKPACAQNCGLHSWPKPPTEGLWSSCCYNAKNPNAHCMWDKPMEFTKDWVAPLIPFRDDAVENAAIIYGVPNNNTEKDLLNMWIKSVAHNSVITNINGWGIFKWKSIGAGIAFDSKNKIIWAYHWFSAASDPNPYKIKAPPSPISIARFPPLLDKSTENDHSYFVTSDGWDVRPYLIGGGVGASIVIFIAIVVSAALYIYSRKKKATYAKPQANEDPKVPSLPSLHSSVNLPFLEKELPIPKHNTQPSLSFPLSQIAVDSIQGDKMPRIDIPTSASGSQKV